MKREPSTTSNSKGQNFTVLDERIRQIYLILGTDPSNGKYPVLLPIPKGEKGPRVPNWQKITWEDTKKSEYQEKLIESNIGVLLGKPSGGLISIDIDDDEGVEELLKLNPGLRDTLITKGKRGCNIWLWMIPTESYPDPGYPQFHYLTWKNKTIKDEKTGNEIPKPFGEWRGGGGRQTVIYGVHPSGKRYEKLTDAKPLAVKFEEIAWPDDIHKPWGQEIWRYLEKRHGPPWLLNPNNGTKRLLEPFWVGKFCEEHDIIWEPNELRYYEYQPAQGLWTERSKDALKVEFSNDMRKNAEFMEEHWLYGQRNNHKLNALVELLRGYSEEAEAFHIKDIKSRGPRRKMGIVHVKNGMLNLSVNPPRLAPFNKSYRSRNIIDIDIDEKAKCPRFYEELLVKAVPEEDIELLQKWAGQILLGHNLAQKIMILTGKEGRGKSTFLRLLARVIGMDNVGQIRTKHLEERFELFSFIGRTFLIGPDVPGNFMNHSSAYVLKMLAGGDPLTAERKNGESFTIWGNFNIGISCNTRLRVKLDGDTGAWRRRLLLVEYEKDAPERIDPFFVESLLTSEASGILNWMIAGALKILFDFHENGRWTLTDNQKRRVDDLLVESDSVREFVKAMLELNEHSNVTTEELKIAYLRYCENRGWRPMLDKEISAQLPEAIRLNFRRPLIHSIKRGDAKPERGYAKLKLLDDEAIEEKEIGF